MRRCVLPSWRPGVLASLRLSAAALLLAGAPGSAAAQSPKCAPDNAGLTLPRGFCAVLVAESLGSVRHLAVAPNGDVFAARNSRQSGPTGGVIVLRDTTGDGKADVIATFFSGAGGSGIALAPDAVYFAPNDRVLRFPWKPGALAPSGPADSIAQDLPAGRGHTAKGIVLGKDGALYVSFGSLTNSCQAGADDRKGPFPGANPCTELEERAGVWRFDARKTHQTPADGKRWATGLRNPMSVSLDPATGTVYAGVHGRDQLSENWSWPPEEGRENPAETVFALTGNTDGGWPYCYFDPRKKRMLQNPEYGGDGNKVGDCDKKNQPVLAFPAHWAPNATLFYSGTQFPAEYRGGLFIAFHGSWNRAPAPQEGFRVVFAPFKGGKALGSFETFAAPAGDPTSIRPSGLAVGPDGSLYIGADANGKIWRVMYRP
ncbi:MAG TPA: PQQ-dependent sugar dehydrogenase [Gemmatimonadales bacterium]|nr:PQQ-dependent sugar dehydrogenase [Gemmatimonadales bacterium]